MAEVLDATLRGWLSDPRNTARSVLVTISGDTLLPKRESVWLAELFQLTAPFGFSERLVRTSMYRLSESGWFTSERIGRQSRYSLTSLAVEESRLASERIYNAPHPDWTGEWIVAFLNSPSLPSDIADLLTKRLKWLGFVALADGVLASPSSALADARTLCEGLAPDTHVPLAVMEFSNLDAVVANGLFEAGFDFEAMSQSYTDFASFYEPLSKLSHSGSEAFALRTMLIHDLRRIRLSAPDIPAALLPADWAGTTAQTLALDLHLDLSATAKPWLSEVLGSSLKST